MRVFLTLCSLAAVALAKPQYNYGSGVSGSFGSSTGSSGGRIGGFGGFGGSSGLIGAVNSGLSSGSLGGGSLFGSGSTYGRGGLSFGSGSVGGGGSHSSSSSNYNQYSQQQTGQFETPLVHKQFISVSAPEDNENLEHTKHLVIGRPQKNYRVVFIKAPSSTNANVKLSAEYAPQEEKTVIYVLSKKDSSLDVSDIATPAPSIPSKPEVFFIKYKTEEEAHHAQTQIQAEYDRIEGSSEHTDAGVAPQQSVVGILDNGAGHSYSGHSGSSVTGSLGGGVSSSGSSGFGSTGSTTLNIGKSSAYLPPAGQ